MHTAYDRKAAGRLVEVRRGWVAATDGGMTGFNLPVCLLSEFFPFIKLRIEFFHVPAKLDLAAGRETPVSSIIIAPISTIKIPGQIPDINFVIITIVEIIIGVKIRSLTGFSCFPSHDRFSKSRSNRFRNLLLNPFYLYVKIFYIKAITVIL
jgi:hypothetical protein